MTTDQYCLRWNDHRNTLVTNFERLLVDNISVDCTLAAEGQCLKAHKVVLSACSPYFELMLNQDKEKHPIIFMKDMKFKELQEIVQYMYRGEVVIPQDQLASLLKAAESLQIKGLGCGEKSQTSGSRTSTQQPQPYKQQILQSPLKQTLQQQTPQQQPPQQQPHLQIIQKQVQPFRQSAPVSRAPDVSQASLEAAPPQIVDLTDDRMAMNTSVTTHLVQENAKRSMAQNTARVKRAAYSSTPERFNLDNLSAVNHYPFPQNNLVASAGQAVGANMIVTTTSVASVITTPTKQSPIVSRQTNESVGHSIPKTVTPPIQRPETHDKRESGNQPLVFKSKNRAITIQKRYVQGNVMQTTPRQNTSPVTLPSQSPTPAGVTKVSTPTTKEDTASVPNESDAVKIELNTTPSPLPEVQETNCTADELQTSDSKPPDTKLESGADPETDQSLLEDAKETSTKKIPSLNKPGPSGVGKTPGKPGRRGRTPAGERKYPCTECNKKFTHKNYLENHLRIHDGECYECDYCTKSFLSRAALVKHLRTHAAKATTNPSHKCQLCGASFPNAADLEKHLTDHTLSGNSEEKNI